MPNWIESPQRGLAEFFPSSTDSYNPEDPDWREERNREIREECEELFENLRTDPDNRWAVWAYHDSSSAASTRPYSLRKVEKYKKYDLEWRSRKFSTAKKSDLGVVLVRWKHSDKNSPIYRNTLPGRHQETELCMIDIGAIIADGDMEAFEDELIRALDEGRPIRVRSRHIKPVRFDDLTDSPYADHSRNPNSKGAQQQ